MTDNERLEELKDSIYAAKQDLASFIAERWPPGTHLFWEKRGHLQHGQVTMCGREKLRVCNADTGKEYWVDIYFVQLAMRVEDALEAA